MSNDEIASPGDRNGDEPARSGPPRGFAGAAPPAMTPPATSAPPGFAGGARPPAGAPAGFAGASQALPYGSAATAAPGVLASTSGRDAGGRPRRDYPPDAATPLWWFLASIGLGVGAVVFWFISVLALADNTSDQDFLASLSAIGLLATFIILASYVCTFMWIRTIGKNGGTFGVGLILAVSVPIYLLPFAFLGAWGLFLAVLAYICWPWRMFVTGIWNAGRLPPAWALLGWAPAALALVLLLGAAVALNGSDASSGDTGVAVGIFVGAQLLLLISTLFYSVALLVVTIVQHIGIRRDRELAQSWRTTAG